MIQPTQPTRPSFAPPRGQCLLRRLTSVTLAALLSAALLAGQLSSAGSGHDTGTGTGSGRAAGHGPVRLVEGEPHLVGASVADRVKRALRIAKRQRGDRYKYGAEGPDRFDCSGLVWFSTHRAGFDDVPRTSAEQGRYMRQIKRKNLRRGDFVFFTGSSGVYHVGVYVGRRDGRRAVLHAPEPGARVRIEKVWTGSWFPGTLRR